jgi:hypothetical protein
MGSSLFVSSGRLDFSESSEARFEATRSRSATIVPVGPHAQKSNSSPSTANSKQSLRTQVVEFGFWRGAELRLLDLVSGKYFLQTSGLHFFVGVE